MRGMYYFVTRCGPQVSIFSLEFFQGELILTRIIASGPVKRDAYAVPLRAVCLREGIIGFLSQPGSSVIVGLVGAFDSLRNAIECWQVPELELADHRWENTTASALTDLRRRNDPRVM